MMTQSVTQNRACFERGLSQTSQAKAAALAIAALSKGHRLKMSQVEARAMNLFAVRGGERVAFAARELAQPDRALTNTSGLLHEELELLGLKLQQRLKRCALESAVRIFECYKLFEKIMRRYCESM